MIDLYFKMKCVAAIWKISEERVKYRRPMSVLIIGGIKIRDEGDMHMLIRVIQWGWTKKCRLFPIHFRVRKFYI